MIRFTKSGSYTLKKTHKAENLALKFALNGTFGRTNHKDSWLYDPKYFIAITLNGQLLLCMLSERMLKYVPGLRILQINTDGITVQVPNDPASKVKLHKVCQWWEKLTKQVLEYASYDKMFISHVNSYLAVYPDGGYKAIGAFCIDKDLHKDHSQRIVPLALTRYFIDQIPVEDTIKNHFTSGDYGKLENYGIHDFCKAVKGNKKFSYNEVSFQNGTLVESPLQTRVNRYYVSNEGNVIKKYGGEKGPSYVEASPRKGHAYKSTIFNEIVDGPYDINYQYYIRETKKIIDLIESPVLNLF